MEDALISPMGFMILSGAGLVEANDQNKIKVHTTEITDDFELDENGNVIITLKEKPYFVAKNGQTSDEIDIIEEIELDDSGTSNYIYVMNMKDGEPVSEPYIPKSIKQISTKKPIQIKDLEDLYLYARNLDAKDNSKDSYQTKVNKTVNDDNTITFEAVSPNDSYDWFYMPLPDTLSNKRIRLLFKYEFGGDNDMYINIPEGGQIDYDSGDRINAIDFDRTIYEIQGYIKDIAIYFTATRKITLLEYEVFEETEKYQLILDSSDKLDVFSNSPTVLADYYVSKNSGAMQIDITPNQFGGNFYLEASTLFREPNGVDMPAEFIIPNCKIQSNFNFTMASSGDPSTFTFTIINASSLKQN